MLKIGITGGIGSGKSLVCKVFEQLGAPVYYADQSATEIFYRKDIQQQIKKIVTNNLVDKTGNINRKQLADLVFSDKLLLDKLNTIIHPAVAAHFAEWIKQHAQSKYILKEAAILFESGTDKGLDKIITVVSPVEMRIARVMKREGWSREEVERRINNQWSDDEKIKRSDFVLYNDGNRMLTPQILELHNKLISLN